MSKEYYKVETSFCSYYVEIWHQYPNMDKVYFGGKRKCVTFSVYFDEPHPNLDALGHNENCNISGDLQRQHGTNHMITSAFAFIRHMYAKKGVSDTYMLRDASYIHCQAYMMSLASYYIMHYDKTWYEKKFKAIPTYDEEEYRKCVKAWKQLKASKPIMSDFFQSVQNKKRRSYLEGVYTQVESLGEFLEQLKDMDCLVYKDWGERLVNSCFNNLNGMSWCIDASRLSVPHINIVSLGKTKPQDMFIHTGGDVGMNVIQDVRYL